MEFIREAINRELLRLNELNLNEFERNQFINRLKERTKSISLIKDFEYNKQSNSAKVNFRTENDSHFKFSYGISGSQGYGLYGGCSYFVQENTFSTQLYGSLNSYYAKFNAEFPKIKLVDFSAFFIPGFSFGFGVSKSRKKSQFVKRYSFHFQLTHNNVSLKFFTKRLKRLRPDPCASPDMFIVPPYKVFGATLHTCKSIVETISKVGVVTMKDKIQPFLKAESIIHIPINDIFFSCFTAGFILSQGTLPPLLRFYRFTPDITRCVVAEELGVSNGDMICACDSFVSGEIAAKFDVDQWSASCFSKVIAASLTEPEFPLEQCGSIFYSFAGFTIERTFFNRDLCITIYHPIVKPDYIRTFPFNITLF